jgi:hypothetical protein
MIGSWWQTKQVEGSATIRFASKLAALCTVLKEYGDTMVTLRQRRRVEALNNIQMLDSKEAVGPLSDEMRSLQMEECGRGW